MTANELTPERKDELLEEIVDAYEQWKTGSSSADEMRLVDTAGRVYYAVKGFD